MQVIRIIEKHQNEPVHIIITDLDTYMIETLFLMWETRFGINGFNMEFTEYVKSKFDCIIINANTLTEKDVYV